MTKSLYYSVVWFAKTFLAKLL